MGWGVSQQRLASNSPPHAVRLTPGAYDETCEYQVLGRRALRGVRSDELVDAVGGQPAARAAFARRECPAVALQAAEDGIGVAVGDLRLGIEMRTVALANGRALSETVRMIVVQADPGD